MQVLINKQMSIFKHRDSRAVQMDGINGHSQSNFVRKICFYLPCHIVFTTYVIDFAGQRCVSMCVYLYIFLCSSFANKPLCSYR